MSSQSLPAIALVAEAASLRLGPDAARPIHYFEAKMDVRFSTLLKHWAEQVPPKILARSQPFAPRGVTLKGRHPVVGGLLGGLVLLFWCGLAIFLISTA